MLVQVQPDRPLLAQAASIEVMPRALNAENGEHYPGGLPILTAVKTDKRAVAGWKPDRACIHLCACGSGPLTAANHTDPELTGVSGPF
jgi:hypothetical protein